MTKVVVEFHSQLHPEPKLYVVGLTADDAQRHADSQAPNFRMALPLQARQLSLEEIRLKDLEIEYLPGRAYIPLRNANKQAFARVASH